MDDKKLLLRAEETERQLLSLESRLKKVSAKIERTGPFGESVNLINEKRDELYLNGTQSVLKFRADAAGGIAYIWVSFACCNESSGDTAVRLSANGKPVAAQMIRGEHGCYEVLSFWAALPDLKTGEVLLELAADYPVTLCYLDINVLACNAIKTGG